MNSIKPSHQRERMLVTEWHEYDTVMGHGTHASQSSAFLAATQRGIADKHTGVLAGISSTGPDLARFIPEGLPLSREVTVTGWDAEKEGIILQQLVGVIEDSDGLVLWWRMHLSEHFI